jgi:hypothetical protein
MPGFEQGQDAVGLVATFMVHGRFLLKSAKDQFLGLSPQVNMWHHVSSMELWVCVLFESNGEGYGYTWDPSGARGARDGETLAECKIDPKKPM